LNILISALHPVGGIRTYFRYVYGNNSFEDINITLLAPDDGLCEFLKNYLPKSRIKLIPVSNNNTREFIFKLREQLKSGKYDIVHSHGFSAGIIGVIANSMIGVKHIMTGHDVFSSVQFKGIKGKIKKSVLSLMFQKLDVIHTISIDAQNNFVEFFPNIDRRKYRSILNGIDTRYFSEGVAGDLRNKMDISPQQPVIGFFGRFMAQKGFRILVDAIGEIVRRGKIEEIPIVFTFGWGGFIREDFAYIEKLGLSKYFVQMEATNDMPAAIRCVDLIVMPSRWEACPLLPMEALSSAVPIIGTNCLGLGEVLEGTPADVIEVDDTNALVVAILDNLANPRNKEYEEYQKQAIERFDVEYTAKKVYALYEEVLI